MLKEPTIEKLKAMRLEAMVSAWSNEHEHARRGSGGAS